MSLTTLLRPPVVWFAAAEIALMAILGAVAWHVWLERVAPAGAGSASQVAAALPVAPPMPTAGRREPAATPSALPSPRAPAVGPTPGIRTDADFLSRQLVELNRVEATFEDLEWRATKAIVDAIQQYVQGVVLPSIDRSERGQR